MAGPHMPPPLAQTGAPKAGPLWLSGLVVLALHGVVLLSLAGAPIWQIEGPQSLRVAPVQTRWVAPEPATRQGAVAPSPPAPRQTRVATVTHADTPDRQTPTPLPTSTHTPTPTPLDAEPPPSPAQAPGPADAVPPSAAASETLPPADRPAPDSPALAQAPAPAPTPAPAATSTTDAPAGPTLAMPSLGVAALPASALLTYRLSGQEKGVAYQATGELRWQRNAGAYTMALSVRAFLLGTRHWRSQGLVTAEGLAPVRFSDSWRSERATHFDRVHNRIVFSSNAPVAPLQAGAQDQISLYAQLAALMAQEGARLTPGTRVQVQTATVRDALPWLLVLEQQETLQLEGQPLQATKWLALPRSRFDAKVEFWVAEAHGWLPVRIRITQVSGNFIDLLLTAREALPELPAPPSPG